MIRITIFDSSIEEEPFEELGPHTALLLKKKLKNDKIDYYALALMMASTIILTMNNLYLGHSNLDHDEFVKKITENLYCYIKV